MKDQHTQGPLKGPILQVRKRPREVVFFSFILFCFTPAVNAPIALVLGLLLAQVVGHPYPAAGGKAAHWLLQASVVGLGFGMNIHQATAAGSDGFGFALLSIAITLVLGALLGRWLGVERKTAFLISSGTAVCGGSAIAAVSPVIRANAQQVSVALGCIFVLNSAALFLFPFLGHCFGLSQHQFGLWCALAIQDTSSVVGAAARYGAAALGTATTVKLARALWIIPLTLAATRLFKSGQRAISMPYFIGLFVLALLANTYLPFVHRVAPLLVRLAKGGLQVTLLLIGAGLSRDVLRSVGVKPLLQGTLLWIVLAGVSLYAILRLA